MYVQFCYRCPCYNYNYHSIKRAGRFLGVAYIIILLLLCTDVETDVNVIVYPNKLLMLQVLDKDWEGERILNDNKLPEPTRRMHYMSI